MKIRFSILAASLSLVIATMIVPGSAPTLGAAEAQVQEDFQAYLKRLGGQAVQQGVSQRTVDSILPTLNYNQRVVALDRSQPGGAINSPIPKFAPYKAKHVDAARIGSQHQRH